VDASVFNSAVLHRIDNNVKKLLTNQGAVMTVLADLQAADAAIKMAVDNAITLIMSLHTGTGSGGSVSDADVETVVADLNAAAMALSAATPQP
jgi:hypothetical protein